TLADGTTLKADLMNGPVQVHMSRATGTRPDGTIDNGVVSHEWGHYLHHRLVNCGYLQCGGMSEGWAHFDSIMSVLRPGDDLNGTFAMAIYATLASENAGYYGIRRWPYTTDMSKNGLTFQHIANGAVLPAIPSPMSYASSTPYEVHNQGEF